MKKYIIKSSVLVASAMLFVGCSENAWNDHLDGFEGGFTNTTKVTVSYTLTNTDYETIGKALAKIAVTDEETAAAKAIQSNHYFDQSSVYPAQIAIPYLFDDSSSDFFIYNNGSVVEATFEQAQGTPDELSKISAAYTYSILSPTSTDELPSLLKQKYPNATAGEYAIVSYLDASTTPVATNVSSVKTSSVSTKTVVSTRGEDTWTVAEALANMDDGFEGEAVVTGIISSIDDLSTSYGNATYYIKDNLSDEKSLQVFRGYYLNGDKFTSEDQLEVGATVTVSGNLTIYNGTYEFNSGSKILSYSAAGETPDYDMLTDNIKDVTDGMTLSATAVVTAQCTRGLILTDNAGSILYYNTGVDLESYPIGTVVEVSGEISSYNKGFQLSNTASVKVVGNINYLYPTATDYTGEMVTAACEGTNNILAQYCSIEGVVTFSGNYINVAITGTSIQGSAYYITNELKEKIVSGSYYKLSGYFTSFTSSYFYIVVTDVEEATPAVDPDSLVNAILYFDGNNWLAADNATVINPLVYNQMGFNNNDLSDPEVYIPLYLKNTYPYALSGDEVYVAYNLKSNAASCDLFVYDGSDWALNNNGLETVTAAFTKTDGDWYFTKYLGQAVFTLFEEEAIVTDKTYLLVSGDVCANPVLATNNYGYLLSTSITISGSTVIMPNENNGFQFLSEPEVNGSTVKVPEGYFVIKDSNDRFLYLQGTYSSFNVTDSPALDNGSFTDNYLFSATKNGNGSWTITNKANGRNIYYSSGYSNFAAYESAGENDSLPFLYILE